VFPSKEETPAHSRHPLPPIFLSPTSSRQLKEMRMETAVNQWKKRAAMSRLKVPPMNARRNNTTEEDELYNSLEAKRRESSG